MGCRPGDIVFECMNYNLYSGGLSDHLTFETLGAATIPFGVGHSERLLSMMAGLRDPVGIWATPSYAVRLAEVAGELGIEPRSVGLRRGYFSGEAGLQVPGYRERIEDTWGMVARDQYGTGELGLHSGECDERNGVHYGGTGIAIAELIDPDSGDVLPFVDGQQGEVVYTSIRREACPLLRMRSHDLMQVFTEPCPCGRTTFRFRILGRSDDMFIVKGVNVFPLAIQAVLMALAPRVTGEFRVVLDRPPPIDYPVPIAVEVARDVPVAATRRSRARSPLGSSAELNFTAAVTLVGPGAIATEGKTRRVVRRYRGEVAPMTRRRRRDQGRRRDRHARPAGEAERHRRRDARRAARGGRGDRSRRGDRRGRPDRSWTSVLGRRRHRRDGRDGRRDVRRHDRALHAACRPPSAPARSRSSRPSTATPWPVASSSRCCATSGSRPAGRSSGCPTRRSASARRAA